MTAATNRVRSHKARSSTELSRRELEVAALVASGLSNAAIAARLHVARKTIEKHVSHVFKKAQVTSRAQLIISIVAPSSPYYEQMRLFFTGEGGGDLGTVVKPELIKD